MASALRATERPAKSEPALRALLAALHRPARVTGKGSRRGGSSGGGGASSAFQYGDAPVPAAADVELVRAALLWCGPLSADPPKAKERVGEEEEDELRAWPSSHTCLVALVALQSLLSEGTASRFWALGGFHAVYLACAMNFVRDSASGVLFSAEVACVDHQEEARKEADNYRQVAASHDPFSKHDWEGYFTRVLRLVRVWEHWGPEGDDDETKATDGGSGTKKAEAKKKKKKAQCVFIENAAKAPRRALRGHEYIPVSSFRVTSTTEFAAAALGSDAPAGAVLVYRAGPAADEPFGAWLAWLRLSGGILVVDLQNCGVYETLSAAIEALGWDEPPRKEEVFWAPMRGSVATVTG